MMTKFESAEHFLQRFHTSFPSATSRSFADGKTSDGGSSYDLLSSIINKTDQPQTILDLACGDGYLLQKLLTRGLNSRLIGLDMNFSELQIARRRSRGHRIDLIQARAQDLPLCSGEVDYVLCHMSLMLMDQIDQVVGEIKRVLRAGGVLSAIVGAGPVAGGIYDMFISLLKEALMREPVKTVSAFGDKRVRTFEGLRSLFSDSNGFAEPIQIEDFVLTFDAEIDKIIEILFLSYDVALLSNCSRSSLETEVKRVIGPLVLEGDRSLSFKLRMITCRSKHMI